MRVMKAAAMVVVLVSMVTLAAPAVAQSPIASETTLLSAIARTPQELGNYLSLAQLYFQQGRLDEAERMLASAQTMVRRQRTLSANFAAPTLQGRPSGGAPLTAPPAMGSRSIIDAENVGAVRVGHGIREPKKLFDVKPIYPAIAQSAMVQGIVILEILIDRQGSVADAKVLRSIPLLDQAALDAVSQWAYQPTLLNGVPIPVVMTVTVNFTLGR